MPQKQMKIRVEGLQKRFGKVQALADVSLSVETGKILTLIGPSGSGKTLTLKTILGLIKPDAGLIEIAGSTAPSINSAERDDFLHQFGILFQRSGLFDGLPVWENIGFRLLQEKGNSREQVREIAVEKLRAVGLSADVVDLFPSELSGGMQKRVGIARALAGEPPILFLDEPTAGLDPIMSNVINDLIIENVRKLGSTAIVVTSNLVTAAKVSDDIAMLHEGRCVWSGPGNTITDTGNAYVEQFWNKKKDGPIKMAVASLSF
ncbi:ABC transporter ATP-binding protein [Sneathiella sp.]|jgi:phospholipid/cholesterol/gamma-HCH transport system ATP-binding protein|uniref:ABC transporter ATP-binding protein n=1 Tax=Sneathiella sp. TaxID=1964365 RepID=UPI0039E61194